MKWMVICTTVVLTILPLLDSADLSGVQVVLKYCTNSSNKKYVEKIGTPRTPINRTTSLTSTDVYFLPNVSLVSPLYVHFNSYKKFATQYKPFMVNLKFELCETLRLQTHPMYAVFRQFSGTETNILEPCPYQGHRFIKPYYTNYEKMPMLPGGTWRIDIALTKGLDEEILMLRSYYEITAKGLNKF